MKKLLTLIVLTNLILGFQSCNSDSLNSRKEDQDSIPTGGQSESGINTKTASDKSTTNLPEEQDAFILNLSCQDLIYTKIEDEFLYDPFGSEITLDLLKKHTGLTFTSEIYNEPIPESDSERIIEVFSYNKNVISVLPARLNPYQKKTSIIDLDLYQDSLKLKNGIFIGMSRQAFIDKIVDLEIQSYVIVGNYATQYIGDKEIQNKVKKMILNCLNKDSMVWHGRVAECSIEFNGNRLSSLHINYLL